MKISTSPPLRNQQWYQCPVLSKEYLSCRYLLLTVEVPREFAHVPGQHVLVEIKGTPSYSRSYSIASAPNPKRRIDFCLVTQDSATSQYLSNLKIGQQLGISSARGDFRLYHLDRPLVFIAGGSGIAPMRAFLQALDQDPIHQPIHLLFGTKTYMACPFRSELESHFSQHHSDRLWLVSEDARTQQDGLHGRVSDYVKEALLSGADYYLCGPDRMLVAVRDKLGQFNVKSSAIYAERF